MTETANQNAPAEKAPRTLLQKRQQSTLNNLLKRKASAEQHIKKQTDRLEEKLQPYRSELTVVTKMIDEHMTANPGLDLEPSPVSEQPAALPAEGERGEEGSAANDDPDTLKQAYLRA